MQSDNDLVNRAIEAASQSSMVFTKFLSANDTGLTGSHQCGIYIPKNSVKLIFDHAFERGENHDRFATIVWNGDENLVTKSRFIYYGRGTRNEYRITRFGKDFELLKPDHTGDLVVICKQNDEHYAAFTLSQDDQIQAFLDVFSIAPTGLNKLVKCEEAPEQGEDEVFADFYMKFGEEFPDTLTMAVSAEEADEIINGNGTQLTADELLIRWIDTEYKLFRYIEENYYEYVTLEPAHNLDDFVKTGLEITNRRKARAGKSLEHHLENIFRSRGIAFTSQARTEMNKKPDFIFPSEEAYHDPDFPVDQLTFLGAKTTCKDRWRQVLNEANRIPQKYLFTLQQGVSPNQLDEMHDEGLILVVPEPYHSYFPKTIYTSVISLETFIDIVQRKQGH